MAVIMHPDNPTTLEDKAFKPPSDYERSRTEEYDQMLLNVKEAVYGADSRAERLAYLSLVSHLSLPEMQRYIPNLSRYFYEQAKMFAKRGYHIPPRVYGRIKYCAAKVERFIEFITSYKVTVGLPYGRRTVKDTKKRKLEIADTLRLLKSGEIYDLYKKELQERGEQFLLLPESTARKMVHICGATTRKSLHGVDLVAFDDAEAILEKMLQRKWIDASWHAALRAKLLQSRQYLRTDYLIHVKEYSTIGYHCWTHAFSDPEDPAFQKDCGGRGFLPNIQWKHQHTRVCDQCEVLQVFFGDFRATLEQIEEENKEKKELSREIEMMRRDYYDWEYKIDVLKAHQLRTAKSEADKQDILKKMNEGDVLMTLDFAMKHKPLHPRESTVDWYAQRGMTWHITHFTTHKGVDHYQHSMVHIFKGERQAHTNAPTLSSVQSIAKEVGIEVVGWYFSEAQSGKGPCDLTSARVKRKTRSCADARKQVLNPTDFFNVVSQGKQLDGVSYYLVSLEGSGADKKPKLSTSKIDDLSKLNAFTFEKENLRVHRYWNIGNRKLISYKNMLPNDASELIIERPPGGTLKDDEYWQKMGDAKYIQKETKAEMEDEDGYCDKEDSPVCVKRPKLESTLHRCPIETCSQEFISETNLEKYMVVGKHLRRPEKLNACDFALNRYSAFLEMIAPAGVCKQIDNAVENFLDDNNHNGKKQPMGWALPKRRKSGRFLEKVKKFLKRIYDDGERTSVKCDPREAADLMRDSKKKDGSMRFKIEDLLNCRQIAGVFTRFKATKLDKIDRVMGRMKRSGDDDDEIDEVNALLIDMEGDPELEYKTEPLFDDTEDMRMAIHNEREGELREDFEGEEDDNWFQTYQRIGWLGERKC